MSGRERPGAPDGTAVTAPLAEHPEVRAALDLYTAWVESRMAYTGQPGLSIGLVHDQTLVWARGFGRADVEARRPATPDTLYRIASITKLFTATAIVQLRDAGRLRLDDPVAAHLPWFKVGEPGSQPITLRHLLTHTSGLTRESPFPYWTDFAFPSIEEIRDTLDPARLVLAPDTRWKYSNLALTVAGEVVAAVSGRPYADYVRDEILLPLGMTSTLVDAPDPDHPRLAAGYGRRLPSGERARRPFTDTRGLTPAASMTTSVRDLARFAMLQFRDGPAGGAQVLAGPSVREMHRVHWLEPDWQAGWGLGFRLNRQDGKTFVGHGGAVQGYRTNLRCIPADRVAIVVLTNADDGNPVEYADRATQWVVPALVKAAAPAAEAPAVDPAWRRYAGRYRSAWADWQVLVLADGLAMFDPSAPDPMLSLVRLTPVGPHAFQVATRDGFGHHGELCVFELAPGGGVARLKLGENYAEPVADW